ncbi:Uracil phosphoribosyltransferase [Oleidesulfovibrio alaskensis G20]|jgi:pyrimidine operon attenuation protein/uracil phosphoribosyltransferase|uniref:Bifunctional protein PyrR n=1 Tax=Oleidesulfovibrio alaskensis (strain ATCC BAA-1058 / DSM 17464 / G20) TaxID=207559 RepID=Q30ZT3_OLEA2|nr:bifunctional pyr operon transcriptional regulator/uracil phosphoribosyltransferase PyrR [Oleidesulfovibrio alaskensis]ABB38813.1 Uracil phosphoribosyltransferase [Oleidesulfovibrio alaskensis G20]MBG0773116.1 bifunctional pyr operon transcriptional regulator/uracil phosphoribosyltransferase PyrR [Oleidesulfovibrio alaskensis]MBL3582691.1 bifunctional pyr operon transcriptional regulator/uracil phosphoribosyltransferase PyrR [Oleidesulfovibrio alaskensis]
MQKKCILSAQDIARTLERLACEVLERHGDADNLALVGIQRRGVDIAGRLRGLLSARLGREVALGSLDINLYRDDWTSLDTQPMINRTELPFAVDDARIVLVDDVLYTGRTIRSALEAILDYGRPERVELLVLVDRGHRELPIHADYVGKSLTTGRDEQVNVLVSERDGDDAVMLLRR